ncbi:MAG TPA: ATP-dependent helicase [Streptosporangiaceae bacterium]|jgi:DNA helicase-2/ATP-dependent DNA helicase PcrA|nr:ATP-dependent helicase [Streptosporangiaceae bacterium]
MTGLPGVLDVLNDDQRRAATHQGGPLLILAGAGTGKTGTLVARAAWLRDQGIQPSRILLLTFTRRAADDMLARAQPPDSSAAERIFGGTFHAVAHRIIRAHAEAFALPPEFTVIDPADSADVMDTLRDAHGLVGTSSGRRTPRAAACAEIYSRCVSTSTQLADVVAAGYPWCVPFTEQLGAVFTDFVAYKRRHGLVDFDDLLLLWRAALADAAAGPVLRDLFDAVLVDEYQDVNAVQAEIVRLLRPDGTGLTCVGDDAQAIYAFRGADPAHLRALTATFSDLAIVRLSRNYRSRHEVLGLANVVRPQFDGLELALSAERGPGHRPLLIRCHDEATQAREICARILADHESGVRFTEQAVLVRSAHHSDLLEIELAARGIPYVKYGGLRFTEAAHVKDFLAAARVVANPADDLAWFRLLRLHEGIGPVLARRVIDMLLIGEPEPFLRWPDAEQALPQRSATAVGGTVRQLAQAAGQERTADRAAVILAALREPLAARYADAAVRFADLERLADAAADSPSLHDALVQLALDPPVSASDLAGRPRRDDDYVVISTVHSAKGLEWPVVHLPQLVDGAVPSDMALTSPAGLEEEQRLFYVAVTRARDRLYLYAPLRMHHHRMARDDRHSYGQLSRFLDGAALAHCEQVQAVPPRPALRPSAPLALSVDRDLASLWGAG